MTIPKAFVVNGQIIPATAILTVKPHDPNTRTQVSCWDLVLIGGLNVLLNPTLKASHKEVLREIHAYYNLPNPFQKTEEVKSGT